MADESTFAADREDTKRFKLVHWFAVLSLLSILGISLISSTLLSRFMTQTLLRRDAVVAMEFVNSMVRAQNASSYFYGNSYNPTAPELEVFFSHVAHMPDVLRANVYAKDRTILWSSDPDLIGRKFDVNHDLDEAFAGKLAPEIETIGEHGKEEHIDLGGPDVVFVENYLPIWSKSGNAIVGVVEVYRSPTALLKAIEGGQQMIWLISLLAGVALFIGLFWIVRFANGILEHQHARLVDAERLAVIGEMASAVAHGLRNPLASIRSSAELAVEDDLPVEAEQSLNNIISEADRLESWIRGFLTQSPVCSHEQKQSVAVEEVVTDCLNGFNGQFAANGVGLTLKLDSELPKVRADFEALRQAMNSVVSNSIEAMEGGGELVVESRLDSASGQVCVEFSDSGPGITKEMADKLFEPFETSKESGLGVGLTLTKRLIERFDGQLDLSNRREGGVSVKILLPIEGQGNDPERSDHRR